MNQAREKENGQIIDAESLLVMSRKQLPEFECLDENCKIPLIPCSFKKHNKNRPHFKTIKGKNHTKDCKFSEYLRLIEKGKDRALSDLELKDMPYPTKFIQKSKKETIESNLNGSNIDSNIPSKNTKRGRFSGEFIVSENKSKNTSSISPIVDFYIKCPYNRDVELEMFDTKKPYMYWFKRIKKPINETKYKGEMVYFGRLHSDKNKIIENDKYIKIIMYECDSWIQNYMIAWNGEEEIEFPSPSKTQNNPFVINILKSKLSQNKLTRIKNELNLAIDENLKDFKQGHSNKKKNAFVFFYGKPTNNSNEFQVKDGISVSRYCQIHPTKGKRQNI